MSYHSVNAGPACPMKLLDIFRVTYIMCRSSSVHDFITIHPNSFIYKMDEMIYQFQNLNGTAEIWEWISSFIPHFIMAVITYPC